MDSNIRELTGVAGLMTIDDLDVQIMFGKKAIGFAIADRGPDSLAGDELETFLEEYQDEKILICITIRWLAVIKSHGFLGIFKDVYNCSKLDIG